MLDDNLRNMLDNLMFLYDLEYQNIKPKVLFIIKNNIKDITRIEHYLERLLNIPTDKCYKLFIKLCDYTRKIDKDVADDYIKIYDELYGEEPKTKRR